MKKLKNITVILVIPCILIGIFLYSSISSKTIIKLDEERSIRKSIYVLEKLNLKDKYDLMNIINDSIFFISWNEGNKGRIYLYDNKKKEVNQYASIGNNVIISNYFKNNTTNNLFVLDSRQKKLLAINNHGKIDKTYNLNLSPARGILYSNNFLFTTWEDDLLIKFYEYNLKSGDLKQIPNKIFDDNKKNTGVLYDGILKQSYNEIALIPYATNEVLFFDSKFNFNHKLKLISHQTDFKLTKMKNGELMVDPNNLYPNINADIYKGNLYILTNESGVWDTKDKYYVDIYDIKKKKYLYSYYIDDNTIRPREIIVKNNLLYVLGKNKLNIYEIK